MIWKTVKSNKKGRWTVAKKETKRGPGAPRKGQRDESTLLGRIGKAVEEARIKKGMSVDELATALEKVVSRSSIFQIEGGRTDFQLSKLEAIAAALGVSVRDLIK